MAVRKKDVQSSEKRIQRRIERIIDDHWFRENVAIGRDLLGINSTNRHSQYNKVIERFTEKGLYFVEASLNYIDFAISTLHSTLPIEKKSTCSNIVLLLAGDGIPVSERFFFAALCFDFEGNERKEFIDYMLDLEHPVKIDYWYPPVAQYWSFEQWQKQSVKPNHIYLDVTHASLDDVTAFWNEVQEAKKRLHIPEIPRGRPHGAKDTSIEERDNTIWDIYNAIMQVLKNKGLKKLYSRRWDGIYDRVRKTYSINMNIDQNLCPSTSTVKRIIAKKKNESVNK